MTRQADLERTLRGVLRELEPYLPDVVLIGGWVPYLYRHYGGFAGWGGTDTLTRELDLLVDRPFPPEGRPALAELLRASGFRPEREGNAAAVWVRDVEAGEKIEFIGPHRGTARGQGHSVPVEEQPGVGAIPLAGVGILRSHTQVLPLPAAFDGPALDVRVPTLGAYIVNKALTFLQRGERMDESGTPKLAKDLLYLRDLMAGGSEVVARIEEDVEEIAGTSPQDADRVRSAATHLGFAVQDHLKHHLTNVARLVRERGATGSVEQELARSRGYLVDLHEILVGLADRYAPIQSASWDDD